MKLAILIIILDFDWLHILFEIYFYFHTENMIDDFMEYYRTEWPNGSIPPKLHMLEDHATDFVEKWKTGFGMYGEQGGESIHNYIFPDAACFKMSWKHAARALQSHPSRKQSG